MPNPEWDNYKTPPQRYRLVGDGSGHDYTIPVGLEEQFYKWVQAAEDGEEDDYHGPDFEEYRVECFTFTDPQEG